MIVANGDTVILNCVSDLLESTVLLVNTGIIMYLYFYKLHIIVSHIPLYCF